MKRFDLFIIGSQKSGTNSILRILEQHPKIQTHSTTEIPFFIMEEEYSKGLDFVYSKYFPTYDPNKLLIGKNVGIFEDPKAIQRLAIHNENMKVVVVLRDPVKRAYSAFWHMKRLGVETKNDFKDVIFEDVKNRFPNDLFLQRNCNYLERGNYYDHLQNLENFISPSQLHITTFKNLKEKPQEIANQLFVSLNLTKINILSKSENKSNQIKYPWLASLTGAHNNNIFKKIGSKIIPVDQRVKIRNYIKSKNQSKKTIPELDKILEAKLKLYYKEKNKLLAETYNIKF